MACCETCGRTERLVWANIEGSDLNVCSLCARYGIIKQQPLIRRRRHFPVVSPEEEFKVVANFAKLISKARQEKNMSQEDFAKFLNEKESIIAKWEQGNLKPPVSLARKIGSKLGLFLIRRESLAAENALLSSKKSDILTLGDFIKVRTRK